MAATFAPDRVAVRKDLRTLRDVLRRVRRSDRLTPLNLFGRRNPIQMLDYLERRAHDRSSVQIPVYVSSVEFDGQYVSQLDEAPGSILAVTRDVSLRGVGFTHDQLLSGQYAVVTFDLMDQHFVSLLLEIRWSNIDSQQAYMSGGMFLGIVAVEADD